MKKIDRIITESINKVITEGYTAKEYEPLINSYGGYIEQWLEQSKRGLTTRSVKFTIDLDFTKYNLEGPLQAKGNRLPALITINYDNGQVSGADGIAGLTNYEGMFRITLTVDKRADVEKIKSVLLHEITHVFDGVISIFTNSKSHRHQPGGELDVLPRCISDVLYRLWDTTEFNAWQTFYDFNRFVEDIMVRLEDANEINNDLVWYMFGLYLTKNKVRIPNSYIRNAKRLKKYFLDTSFRQLKKYIKKYDLNNNIYS